MRWRRRRLAKRRRALERFWRGLSPDDRAALNVMLDLGLLRVIERLGDEDARAIACDVLGRPITFGRHPVLQEGYRITWPAAEIPW